MSKSMLSVNGLCGNNDFEGISGVLHLSRFRVSRFINRNLIFGFFRDNADVLRGRLVFNELLARALFVVLFLRICCSRLLKYFAK